MQSTVLVSSFAEIAREKDIDRDTLQVIIEDVFRAMINKKYAADDPEAFQIVFNPDNGDYQIMHVREVVEDFDVEDPVLQIPLSEALEIEDDYEVEDEVAETIRIDDFGRRAVQAALQTFRQRIRDIEKENIHREYSELIGEIVVGEIYQTRRREVLVLHNKVELLLPREEQIPRDRYRKGDMLRAVVREVVRDAGSSPQVVISRTDPVFVERLFELEVPEIYDGIIEIRDVKRMPGERAKMAVVSHDERVDPTGACVGVKGSRIQQVVRELGGENIDIVVHTADKYEYIKRALAPAHPLAVELNDDLDPPRARVTVPADEVSKAIGRGGQNIRLASMLTGYELDVYRDIQSDEEDVDITEFGDAIPAEIIQKLKDIGCDTAKAVLELSAPELARRTELTEEQAKKIVLLMQAEFADDTPEADAGGMTMDDEIQDIAVAAAADGALVTDALTDDMTGDTEAADLTPTSDEAETPVAPAEPVIDAPESGETPVAPAEPVIDTSAAEGGEDADKTADDA